MTPGEFRRLVIAYGGDLERWPAHERSQAHALAQATPELGALLAEATQLDQALRRLGSSSVLSDQRLHDLIRKTARRCRAVAGLRDKSD